MTQTTEITIFYKRTFNSLFPPTGYLKIAETLVLNER